MVIDDRAEEKLVSLLKTIKTDNVKDGCLHIRAGALGEKAFANIPQLISKWLGDTHENLIIICEDKDIFIFNHHIDLAVFIKFKQRFYDWLDYELKNEKELLAFYDLGLSRIGLAEIAQAKLDKKYLRLKMAEERALAEAKRKNKEEILEIVLNTKLLTTLDHRRKSRRYIEILVVEDDPFSRKLIESSLNNYDVALAESGKAAIGLYLSQAPDIVFLDINLPDIDGHEVLMKILHMDSNAYIVMLSGNSNLENIQRTISQGAKGFVGKPFTKEKLLQYIRKCPKSQPEKAGV